MKTHFTGADGSNSVAFSSCTCFYWDLFKLTLFVAHPFFSGGSTLTWTVETADVGSPKGLLLTVLPSETTLKIDAIQVMVNGTSYEVSGFRKSKVLGQRGLGCKCAQNMLVHLWAFVGAGFRVN